MLLYIARQPIFDQYRDILAYELLYRDSNIDFAHITNSDVATQTVLSGSTLVASFEQLVDQKRAFINFTKNLIMNDTPFLFSKDHISIEILEDIIPDEAFIEKLRELKEKGYTLALDDFTPRYTYPEVISLMDIIKVDFMLTTPDEQLSIVQKYKRPGLKFLAEKIENMAEFERAKRYGYHFFQGYYFSKPSILRFKDVASLSCNHLEIMDELQAPTPTYEKLTSIIEKDVSLAYKLFKYVNSPFFGGLHPISSIHEALVRLGFENIKSWIYLLILRSMSLGQTDELVAIALQRAKMLELMAEPLNLSARRGELFLVGLFSMMDILMNNSMEKILNELPLPAETKEAILYRENVLGKPLQIALHYEKGNWEEVEKLCQELHVSLEIVSTIYLKAVKWSEAVTNCMDCPV
ncbi:EAL and HDOD domain-containing protein [Clostridium aminobutyricum]|uniref:HDOD domain-containing protein n=1 Tax=Clostridium aminobutyricum TaxID=33953 RepID=A0A939D904_CLOAM|nr:HDOD domain-containing protein [Clostridium aminobutyricum]MBN7773401.1 HDOD domain-containing protein [Clostridium aminobutyricum]